MPVYGCFRMMIAEPDRTWTADYLVAKSEDVVQFWNRSHGADKQDVLVGVARLGKEHTICEVACTKFNGPKFFRAGSQRADMIEHPEEEVRPLSVEAVI
jgi:hypothetical protein